MIEGWKKLFAPQILERGVDYGMSEAVLELQKRKNSYNATVLGSEIYDVAIYLEQDEIVMTCTCPYAEKGLNCKHMAAVCWCIEEEALPIEEYEDKTGKLEELIAQASIKDLRAFVLELASEDDEVSMKLFDRFGEKDSKKQAEWIKKRMHTLIRRYPNRYTYEGRKNFDLLEYEVERLLCDKIEPMIEGSDYMLALNLMCYFYLQVDKVAYEDSDGAILGLMYACRQRWDDIFEQCTVTEQDIMLSELQKVKQKCKMDYLQEDLEEYIEETFSDEAVAGAILQEIDEEMERLDQSSEQFQFLLRERLSVMEKKGCTAQEIADYRRPFRHMRLIRKMELEDAITQNRLEDAIALCLESRESDREDTQKYEEYTKLLITLYQRTGQQERCKEELSSYIFDHYQSDLTYINQAKALLNPAEWETFFGELLTAKETAGLKLELLAQEGFYQELYQEIADKQKISVMLQYEDILKEHIPLQMRGFWIKRVTEKIETAQNRLHYQEIMGYMKKIRDYPDGLAITAQLAKEWRVTYRRKSAMMNELKKAGF